ncbi:MAG: DUF58 domain-containing protein [Chloroflexota bacterium]
MTVTVLVLLASLLTRQSSLLIAGLALILAEAAAWVWGRYALTGVAYDRALSEGRAFFGEQVTLDVRAENRKLLPLAWLAVEDEFPEPLRLARGRVSPSHKPRRALLSNLLTLRWYERVTRRYPVLCTARGEHTFGPARLRTGDLFGFVEREAEVPSVHRLLVYPRVLPVRGPGIPSRQVLGPLRARRRILEDPLLVAGVREYLPGDSLRRVHWKVSARTGTLHTKLLEPSTDLSLLLFLNVSTVDPSWLGVIEDRLELAVITVASLARQQLSAGQPVGLFVNSSLRGGDQPVRIPPGRSPEQLAHVLDALACVIPFETLPFAAFLQRETRNLPWGATIVAVSGVMSEAMAVTLVRLRRAGRSVALVLVGDDHERPALSGVPVWLVRGERMWRTCETVELV